MCALLCLGWINFSYACVQTYTQTRSYRTQVVDCRNSRVPRGPTGQLLAPGDILARVEGQSLRGLPMEEVRMVIERLLRKRTRFEPIECKVIPAKLLVGAASSAAQHGGVAQPMLQVRSV